MALDATHSTEELARPNDQRVVIHFRNVPESISTTEFRNIFAVFGTIVSFKVFEDKLTSGKMQGFISYDSPESAHSALLLDNEEMEGSKIMLTLVGPRTQPIFSQDTQPQLLSDEFVTASQSELSVIFTHLPSHISLPQFKYYVETTVGPFVDIVLLSVLEHPQKLSSTPLDEAPELSTTIILPFDQYPTFEGIPPSHQAQSIMRGPKERIGLVQFGVPQYVEIALALSETSLLESVVQVHRFPEHIAPDEDQPQLTKQIPHISTLQRDVSREFDRQRLQSVVSTLNTLIEQCGSRMDDVVNALLKYKLEREVRQARKDLGNLEFEKARIEKDIIRKQKRDHNSPP
ncbi:hypothetical protein BLNAU_2803 [Blattamonas nauphoetae]|uniref:RRM domain-containing protein n=1 Tax=Blattamonas nauphoetae TaxID=2049346 RepID=A0ABQ9YEG1_9EUKA|nr:hypothetical protein BLNAU_2803 [Blattamonas nauphoetae]